MHIRGVNSGDEVRVGRINRDTRRLEDKLADFFKTNASVYVVFAVHIVLALTLPWAIVLILFSGFISYLLLDEYQSKNKGVLRLPFFAKRRDRSLMRGGVASKPQGIFYLGNEMRTNREVWLTKSDCLRHMLVFGTTGSGKTQAILGFLANAYAQGSGFCFVDGKADISTFASTYILARKFKREDDLGLITYITSGKDSFNKAGFVRSNTMNPFTIGSASALTELITSLVGSGGKSDPMWTGRANALLSAVMKALVYKRDNIVGYVLNAQQIRKHFSLEEIYNLSLESYGDAETTIKGALKAYLRSLSGWIDTDKDGNQTTLSDQPEEVRRQHGFLEMQFTKVFSSLVDDYNFIFNTKYGDIDIQDIVLNRRSLIVLLPATEKSDEELQALGRIVVATLKMMIASCLGNANAGDNISLNERNSNYEVPFYVFLDEYGFFFTRGSAVIPAQGRSLGFSVCFAGQDKTSFEKNGNQTEANSIFENTNTKVFMKIDGYDTYQFLEKNAGRVYVEQLQNRVERNDNPMEYTDSSSVNFVERNKTNLIDLKSQIEGQSHILFDGEMVRCNMFYTDIFSKKNVTEKYNFRLNEFVQLSEKAVSIPTEILTPKIFDYVGYLGGMKKIIKNFKSNAIKSINDNLDKEDLLNNSVHNLLKNFTSSPFAIEAKKDCVVIKPKYEIEICGESKKILTESYEKWHKKLEKLKKE